MAIQLLSAPKPLSQLVAIIDEATLTELPEEAVLLSLSGGAKLGSFLWVQKKEINMSEAKEAEVITLSGSCVLKCNWKGMGRAAAESGTVGGCRVRVCRKPIVESAATHLLLLV